MRHRFNYQRLLYSGIESGCGSLLAFSLSGPDAGVTGHIIPVFGHTFNEDTWGPNATGDYFNIGRRIKYTPSEAWMSSFIAHDDNFGPNLCIPFNFLSRKLVDYCVALMPEKFEFPAIMAAARAARFFYSVLPQIPREGNLWMERLIFYTENQKLILRTVASTSEIYADHLNCAQDWEGNKISPAVVEIFRQHLPRKLWVVEVSIPDLFSTNLSKLGEFLIRADKPLSTDNEYSSFVLARLPGVFAFLDKVDGRGHPRFTTAQAQITGHVKVLEKRI